MLTLVDIGDLSEIALKLPCFEMYIPLHLRLLCKKIYLDLNLLRCFSSDFILTLPSSDKFGCHVRAILHRGLRGGHRCGPMREGGHHWWQKDLNLRGNWRPKVSAFDYTHLPFNIFRIS